jgi:hypothetical protein
MATETVTANADPSGEASAPPATTQSSPNPEVSSITASAEPLDFTTLATRPLV